MGSIDSNKDWSGKSRGGTLGYLSFVFLIKNIGVNAAYLLLSIVVVYFIPFAPKATQSTWKYSRRILNNNQFESIIFIYKNFFNLGVAMIDKVAINIGKSNEYSFDFNEPSDVKDILNSSKGVIIIGAHFGNWEVGSPFFDKYNKQMRVVMMDFEYQNIKKILESQKNEEKFKVIAISNNSFSYIFEIRDALSQGKYIAIQGDRLSNSEKHANIPFLGKEAPFPLGPFVLASRLNVPVVFYFAVRTGIKRYTFNFSLAHVQAHENEKRTEFLILNEYVSELEKVVANYPEQWFNYYDFWNYEK